MTTTEQHAGIDDAGRLLQRAQAAVNGGEPLEMLEALTASGYLDGLKRRLQKQWDALPPPEVDECIAQAVDAACDAVFQGRRIGILGAWLWKAARNIADDKWRADYSRRQDFDSAALPARPDPSETVREAAERRALEEARRREAIRVARALLPRTGHGQVVAVMEVLIDAAENGLPDLPADEQARLYRATLDGLLTDVEAVDDTGFVKRRASFLARRAALLQICSNPKGVSETYYETPAKLAALDALVGELVGRQREKVVVWSFYTASVGAITQRYARYGVVRYDGSVSDVGARRDAVLRFQEDDETMVFVANPAAAGAGLTLHRARVAIYESLSNQAAHYLQSLDRIHRRGQERDVEYVVMLCDGTIEVSEYDRLVRKEHAAQDLLGDQVDTPITREAFLADVREAAALLAGAEAR